MTKPTRIAITGAAGNIGYALAFVAAVLAIFWRFAVPLWLCLGVSAFLLVRLNLASGLSRDKCTALADLVLLTPLAILPFALR